MSQVPVTWLAEVLRDAGCKVTTYKGWKTRGRPVTSGSFSPFGVLVHHTGTTTTDARPAPTVGLCITGRSDLPGPLCHAVLGRDGRFHVIAAGRANHAGVNRGSGPIPAGDGNAQMIGIEVDYSGSQDMGEDQYAALIKGAAAIVKHMHRDQSFVRGHKETSTSGKWDPGRHGSSSPEYRMDEIRSDVRKALSDKVRFVLLDGEGKQLAGTGPTKVGWKRELAKLAAFLGNPLRIRKILKALRADGDAVIKRVKA